ncbi:MAG: phytanoyl-CoA dioxygenase family protein [Planctomycetes bacterium]|nr:phytanoyl-CoA dioxygenase family protein [Planctomycetota bacterium]
MTYDQPDDLADRSAGNHFQRKATGKTTVLNAEAIDIPNYAGVEDYIEAIYRDGFAVIKNAIPRDKCARIMELMDNFSEDQYSNWGYGKDGVRREENTFLQKSGGGACAHPEMLAYTNIPLVMEILDTILGKNFHIVGGTSWITGSGRYPMGLHSDWRAISLPEDLIADPRVRMPVFECFAHFYLKDMFNEMGPTIIVPGSHRSGRSPNDETSWNGNQARSFCCEAGDMILFNNEIWHGALPNTSDETRYLHQIQYANMRIGTIRGKVPTLTDEVYDAANLEQRQLFRAGEERRIDY